MPQDAIQGTRELQERCEQFLESRPFVKKEAVSEFFNDIATNHTFFVPLHGKNSVTKETFPKSHFRKIRWIEEEGEGALDKIVKKIRDAKSARTRRKKKRLKRSNSYEEVVRYLGEFLVVEDHARSLSKDTQAFPEDAQRAGGLVP